MTLDEVLGAEPRAAALREPEAYNTGVALASIERLEIGTISLRASFLFDVAGRLSQVNLAAHEEIRAQINVLAFSSLEQLLTEKYGTPIFREEGLKASWLLDATSIVLTHLLIPDLISKVTIMYKPATVRAQATRDL